MSKFAIKESSVPRTNWRVLDDFIQDFHPDILEDIATRDWHSPQEWSTRVTPTQQELSAYVVNNLTQNGFKYSYQVDVEVKTSKATVTVNVNHIKYVVIVSASTRQTLNQSIDFAVALAHVAYHVARRGQCNVRRANTMSGICAKSTEIFLQGEQILAWKPYVYSQFKTNLLNDLYGTSFPDAQASRAIQLHYDVGFKQAPIHEIPALQAEISAPKTYLDRLLIPKVTKLPENEAVVDPILLAAHYINQFEITHPRRFTKPKIQKPKLRTIPVVDDDGFVTRVRTRCEIQTSLIASGIESNPGPGPTMENPDIIEQVEVEIVSQNTTITQAVETVEAPFIITSNVLQEQSTTIPQETFEGLTGRNISVFTGQFTTADTRDQTIVELNIPDSIYDNLDTSTITPLRPYVYLKTDMQLTVKINANQAQAGRYICAFMPCKKQAFGISDTVYRQIQREHAIIDISNSADVIYDIKFENLRSFVPIQVDEIGLLTGESFGSFSIKCLSPINIVDGGEPSVPFQVFAKFVDPYLVGMRYPLPVGNVGAQGGSPAKNKALEIAKIGNSVAKSIPEFGNLFKLMGSIGASAATSVSRLFASDETTARLENNMVYVGLKNKDKPCDTRPPTVIQPHPQKALCNATGPVYSVKMRLEHLSNTPHFHEIDTVNSTTSFREIAQIGGIQTFFTLDKNTSQHALLCELPVAPWDSRYDPPRTGADNELYHYPPVAYLMQTFTAYSGQIEYEFIPIKTPSHNFSILVAFVPSNGNTGTTDWDQAQSCQWKVMDFRTQTSGTFEVPWLCPNIYRTYPISPSGILNAKNTTGVMQEQDRQWQDPGKVCVFLVNTLNPTPFVSPTIEIMVIMRAMKNFQYAIPTIPRSPIAGPMDNRLHSPLIVGYEQDLPPVPQGLGFNRSQSKLMLSGDVETNPGPLMIASQDEIVSESAQPLIGIQMNIMEIHDDLLNVCRRTYKYLPARPTYFNHTGSQNICSQLISTIPIVLTHPQFRDELQDTSSTTFISFLVDSPRDFLLPMYRWYRGGVSLSMINHSTHNLIYTHIPPMLLPRIVTGFDVSTGQNHSYTIDGDYASMFTGVDSNAYASVRNVPSINPTSDLEIPFYNESYYIDIQARYAPGMTREQIDTDPMNMFNGPTQDVLTRTLGMLQISTEQVPPTTEIAAQWANEINITIKMSLADDGEPKHFIGVPPVLGSKFNLIPISGPTPSRKPLIMQLGTRRPTRAEIQNKLLADGVEPNPGPFGYDVMGTIKSTFGSIFSIPSNLAKVSKNTDYFQGIMSDISDKLTTYLGLFCDITASALLSTVTSIISAFTSPSKLTILIAFLNIFNVVGAISSNSLGAIVSKISNFFSSPSGQSPLNSSETPSFLVPLLTSALVEFFCMRARDIDMSFDFKEFNRIQIMNKLTTVFSNINFFRVSAVTILMSRFAKVFTWACDKVTDWYYGFGGDSTMAQKQFVVNFMNDYEFIMNAINISGFTSIRQHRDRFWTTVFSAFYIINYMAKHNIKNHNLNKCALEVVRKADELGKKVMALPVRFEPYMLWCYGEKGLGKSYFMQELLIDMLRDITPKITHPNPIYTRSRDDFWNGYIDQPITYYDDVGAVSHPEKDAILANELQFIKSPAVYGLNMADLRDKHTTFTSMIVGISSNAATYKSSSIREHDAFDRRRDALFQVQFSEKARKFFTDNKIGEKDRLASKLPKEMLKDKSHLAFYRHSSPIVGRSQDPVLVRLDKTITYTQAQDLLKAEFQTYANKEFDNMAIRYSAMMSLMPEYYDQVKDRAAAKAAVLQMTLSVEVKHKNSASEAIKDMVNRLEDNNPEYFKTLAPTTRFNIDYLSKIRAQSNNHKLVGGISEYQASEWFRNKIGKHRIQEKEEWWSNKTMYSCLYDWRTPLELASIDLKDDYICQVCNRYASEFIYICPNSTEEHFHGICTCSSIVTEKRVSCSECNAKMLAVVPEVSRLPDSVVSKYCHAVNYFLENSWIISTEAFRGQPMKIERYLTEMLSTGIILAKKIRPKKFDIAENEYTPFVKRFTHYTGQLPTNVKVINRQNNSISRVQMSWAYTDEIFTLTRLQDDSITIIAGPSGNSKGKNKENKQSSSGQEIEKIDDSDSDKEVEIPKLTLETIPVTIYDSKERVACIHETVDISELHLQRSDQGDIFTSGKDKTEVFAEVCKHKGKVICNQSYINQLNALVFKTWTLDKASFALFSDIHRPNCINKLFKEDKKIEIVEDKPKFTQEELLDMQSDLDDGILKKFLGKAYCVYKFIKSHFLVIFGFLIIIICSMLGYRWYFCSKDNTIIPNPHGQSPGEDRRATVFSNPTGTMQIGANRGAHGHGVNIKDIPLPVTEMRNKLAKNTIILEYAGLNHYLMGIWDNYALIARHSWHVIQKHRSNRPGASNTCVIKQGSNSLLVQFSDIKKFDCPEEEIIILEIPRKGMTAFGKLFKRFPQLFDPDGLKQIHTLDRLGYVYDVTDGTIKSTVIGPVETNPVLNHEMIDIDEDGVPQGEMYRNDKIHEWFVTTIQKDGMCMSPYLNKQGNIIGFHVAGLEFGINKGYSVPVWQHVLVDKIGYPVSPSPSAPSGQAPRHKFENLDYEYTVYNAPFHTHETKILPSPLQAELYTPEKQPCIQSNKDPRYKFENDPLIDGARTIGKETKPIDKDVFNITVAGVMDMYLKVLPAPYLNAPVSQREALTAESSHVLSRINLSTSAGYPLARKGKIEKQKRDFVDLAKDELKPHIAEQFEKDFQNRTCGRPVDTVFWAHLKDELRPIEKLSRLGGTRVFSVAPFELVLNSRRLLLPFMDAFQHNPLAAHHAIGLNPNSKDWMEMFKMLLLRGEKLIQLDFKNYSDSIPTTFVKAAFEIIISYYKHHGKLTQPLYNALLTIAQDTYESRILIYDDVYRLKNGVLAGHPLTSIINSIVNILLQAYIWVFITKEPIMNFFAQVEIFVMGDDVLMSVGDSTISNGYTCDRICEEFMERLGIVATDGNKNQDNIRPYEELYNLEFISRTVVKHPFRKQVMLAPLKMSSIFEVPLWINKGDEDFRVRESLNSTMMLAYDHGPQFYNLLKDLFKSLDRYPKNFDLPTWESIDVLFHGKPVINLFEQKKPKVLQQCSAYTVDNQNDLKHLATPDLKKKPMVPHNVEEYDSESLLRYSYPGLYDSIKVSDRVSKACECRYKCMENLQYRITEMKERRTNNRMMQKHAASMQELSLIRKAHRLGTRVQHKDGNLTTLEGVCKKKDAVM